MSSLGADMAFEHILWDLCGLAVKRVPPPAATAGTDITSD
jgi:hypothetical protein